MDDEVRSLERRWRQTGSEDDARAYLAALRRSHDRVEVLEDMVARLCKAVQALIAWPASEATRRQVRESLIMPATPAELVELLFTQPRLDAHVERALELYQDDAMAQFEQEHAADLQRRAQADLNPSTPSILTRAVPGLGGMSPASLFLGAVGAALLGRVMPPLPGDPSLAPAADVEGDGEA